MESINETQEPIVAAPRSIDRLATNLEKIIKGKSEQVNW
jgi:acetolactate synthase regulatory subunit